MQSKCAVCGSKKSKFIKEQLARGLLNSLGLKAPLSIVLLLGDIWFKYNKNEIVNKFLLVGDKFMP